MTVTAEDVRSYPIFSTLSPALVHALSDHLVERAVQRHLFIFHEGDLCEGLFLLKHGRVKVSKRSSDRSELAIAILRAGDHFDITPIFDDGFQMVTAQALDDVNLHFISKSDLLTLTVQNPQLTATLLATVFGSLRQMTGLLEKISSKSVTARLAAFLLEQTADGQQICLDISQREVSALVGTRREVVSRALSKLEKAGILRVVYPNITILDSDRLRRLA